MGGKGVSCACGKCGLRVAHKGKYRAGHQQPPGTARDPQGRSTASNARNNPVNNGRRQELARTVNDSIVNFCLKRLQHSHEQNIYCFVSWFYPKLVKRKKNS